MGSQISVELTPAERELILGHGYPLQQIDQAAFNACSPRWPRRKVAISVPQYSRR